MLLNIENYSITKTPFPFPETIYELKEDGNFFKCSCPYGQKHYFCKHNIAISIKLNKYAIPDNAISVPLQEKRKRGRPVKNKGWWSKE